MFGPCTGLTVRNLKTIRKVEDDSPRRNGFTLFGKKYASHQKPVFLKKPVRFVFQSSPNSNRF
jgi:hypothetical protein